jgi:hypothetical protein
MGFFELIMALMGVVALFLSAKFIITKKCSRFY